MEKSNTDTKVLVESLGSMDIQVLEGKDNVSGISEVIMERVADNVSNNNVNENLENQIGVEELNIDNVGILRMVGASQIADISVDNVGTYYLGSGNDLNVREEEGKDNVSVLSGEEISKSIVPNSIFFLSENKLNH